MFSNRWTVQTYSVLITIVSWDVKTFAWICVLLREIIHFQIFECAKEEFWLEI